MAVSRGARRLAAVGGLVASAHLASPSAQSPHPLDVFRTCVPISAEDIARLESGAPIVRVLEEADRNIGVFGARRVSIDGARLALWVADVARLKQSPVVDAIARFRDPPALEDLAGLSLDPADRQALRECRPGNCRLKLTVPEIARVRDEMSRAGPQWRSAADALFRQILLARANAYRSGGHEALGRYADGRSPESLATVAASLLGGMPCATAGWPDAVAALERPGHRQQDDSDFLYWAKERVASRPVISLTHVVVGQGPDGRDDVVVLGRQVTASHYLTGLLNLTAVVGAGGGAPHFLVVISRSRVDVLDGLFAGLARRVIERRLREEMRTVIDQMARRLESGPPPSAEYSGASGQRPD